MTTYTWTGGSGNWDDDLDWSPTGVPGAGDNALITAGGTYTVTLSERDDQVDDLTVGSGARLAIGNDDVLVVTGAFNNAGVVAIGVSVGGKLVLDSALTTAQLGDLGNGTLVLQGGLDNVGARLNVNANDVIDGTVDGGNISGALLVSDLTLEGNPTFTGAGGVGPGTIDMTEPYGELFVSGTLTIVDATITMQGEVFFPHPGSFPVPAFSNKIYVGSGDELILASTTTLQVIGADGLDDEISGGGEFVNYGAINVSATGLELNLATSEVINAGTISIANGATLVIGESDTLGGTGTGTVFSNQGTIDINGGRFFADILTTAQLGVITSEANGQLNADLVNEGAVFDVPDDLYVAGEIEGGVIEGTINAAYSLSFLDGPTFVGASGAGPGTINDNGSLDFLGGQSISNVTINIEGLGLDLSENIPTIDNDDALTLSASVTINVNEYSSISGKADLTDLGTINVSDDNSLYLTNFTESGVLMGTGTANVFSATFAEGASLTIASISVGDEDYVQPGALTVVTTLTYGGDFMLGSIGTLAIAADDTFTLSGFSDLTGNVGGPGTLDLAGRAYIFGGAASVFVDNWTITGPGAFTTLYTFLTYDGDFTLSNGAELSLFNYFILKGTSDFVGAAVDGGPEFVTEGNSVVSGLTIYAGVTWINEGDALQYGDGLTLASIVGGQATFANGANGVYDLAGDSGIAEIGGNVIVNAGTIERAAGPGVSQIAPFVANNGEIAINTGTIDFLGSIGGAGHIDVASGGELEFGEPAGTFVFTKNVMGLDAGSTLTIDGNDVAFAGNVDATGATMDGSGVALTRAQTAVSDLTIGGALTWFNTGTVTESGGDVVLGDVSGATAFLFNAAAGVYDIADDHGVADGGSANLGIDNVGLFAKTGGTGISVIAPTMVNTGSIEAESGTLDFQGYLFGAGQDQVGAGATIEVDNVAGAAVQLAFTASTGVVALDDFNASGGSRFFGTISGFGGNDAIDLGAPYGAATRALFAENTMGTGGTLTLIDGALTGHIALAGVYAPSDFAVNSNPAGGAVVTFV